MQPYCPYPLVVADHPESTDSLISIDAEHGVPPGSCAPPCPAVIFTQDEWGVSLALSKLVAVC